MSCSRRLVLAAAAIAAVSACSEPGTAVGTTNTVLLSSAFQTVPAGFSATSNSFDASSDRGLPLFPGDMHGSPPVGGAMGGMGGGDGRDDHHDGFGAGGVEGLLMGGGLRPEFIGGVPFGRDRGRGPFGEFRIPSVCTFDILSGRIACPDRSDDGLTFTLSFALKDTAGVPQAQFDTLSTDYVNVQSSVSGTRTSDDPDETNESAQATLSHTSDRTITGLAPGSTARTVNGTSAGHESVTGTRDTVSFTATRDVSDTTLGLVIPIADGRPTIPSGGTVIRNMSVSITPAGDTTTTHTRREQVTFDGTNVVHIVITQDGTTRNCTITLPRRQMSCE